MSKLKTALPVLLAVFVFGIAAMQSRFVEGDTTSRPAAPGLHPTTEGAFQPVEATHAREASSLAADTPTISDVPEPADDVAGNAPARQPATRKSDGGAPAGYVYWKTVRAKVTSYEPGKTSCGKYADGRTSIGESAWVLDGVAADPRAIPYGTYCVVPGVGGKKVDDTGSAMRGAWAKNRSYHIDVRVSTVREARRWGVKYLDIKLYRKAG